MIVQAVTCWRIRRWPAVVKLQPVSNLRLRHFACAYRLADDLKQSPNADRDADGRIAADGEEPNIFAA